MAGHGRGPAGSDHRGSSGDAGARQGLEQVFAIGKAFEALQLEAMYRSHSNNPIGKRYNDAYALLEKPVPALRINKTDRNPFIWCWQQREAIQRWWDGKAQNQRDRWNHPGAIKRRYLVEHGEVPIAAAGGTAAKPETPLQKANASIARLQQELDAAQAENRRLRRSSDNVSEGRDWTWQDEPEDIAATMLHLHPDKAKRGQRPAEPVEPQRVAVSPQAPEYPQLRAWLARFGVIFA
jgi:hypothetical protein